MVEFKVIKSDTILNFDFFSIKDNKFGGKVAYFMKEGSDVVYKTSAKKVIKQLEENPSLRGYLQFKSVGKFQGKDIIQIRFD